VGFDKEKQCSVFSRWNNLNVGLEHLQRQRPTLFLVDVVSEPYIFNNASFEQLYSYISFCKINTL